MTLSAMPQVERLTLAWVTAVPDWHPEHATFEPLPVYGWIVRHPDGAILIDTGIGKGSAAIDGWYQPEVMSLREALASVRLETADVSAVILSHLHFHHCGQQRMVEAPVYVQLLFAEDHPGLGFAIDGSSLRWSAHHPTERMTRLIAPHHRMCSPGARPSRQVFSGGRWCRARRGEAGSSGATAGGAGGS